MTTIPSLHLVDPSEIPTRHFTQHLADCLILTHDHKILMQLRPENWGKWAGVLNTFGGHVGDGESVADGLVRELHEELCAVVDVKDVVFLGAVTEDFTKHTELVHIHFWHDKGNTITGCYEAEDRRYDSVAEALSHPKLMDYARWALLTAQARGLLK